jgi:hypothetical protein
MPGELVLSPVWRVMRRSRPNLNPPRFFRVGTLTVTSAELKFHSQDSRGLLWPIPRDERSDIRITNVSAVQLRRYGWGLVPRFIAIEFESDDARQVAYFNDGRWLGWRPLLTGSNRRMDRAIRRQLGLLD